MPSSPLRPLLSVRDLQVQHLNAGRMPYLRAPSPDRSLDVRFFVLLRVLLSLAYTYEKETSPRAALTGRVFFHAQCIDF